MLKSKEYSKIAMFFMSFSLFPLSIMLIDHALFKNYENHGVYLGLTALLIAFSAVYLALSNEEKMKENE